MGKGVERDGEKKRSSTGETGERVVIFEVNDKRVPLGWKGLWIFWLAWVTSLWVPGFGACHSAERWLLLASQETRSTGEESITPDLAKVCLGYFAAFPPGRLHCLRGPYLQGGFEYDA